MTRRKQPHSSLIPQLFCCLGPHFTLFFNIVCFEESIERLVGWSQTPIMRSNRGVPSIGTPAWLPILWNTQPLPQHGLGKRQYCAMGHIVRTLLFCYNAPPPFNNIFFLAVRTKLTMSDTDALKFAVLSFCIIPLERFFVIRNASYSDKPLQCAKC